jgi:hypothetical protein
METVANDVVDIIQDSSASQSEFEEEIEIDI